MRSTLAWAGLATLAGFLACAQVVPEDDLSGPIAPKLDDGGKPWDDTTDPADTGTVPSDAGGKTLDTGAPTKDSGSAKDTGSPVTDATVDQSVVDAGKADTGVDAGFDAGFDAGPEYPKPVLGELLVTEIMYDPVGSEPEGEWIELLLKADGPRSLTGLTMRDGSGRTHVFTGKVVIKPNEYKLLVRSLATAQQTKMPSNAILYDYGTGTGASAGVILANGASGAIEILDGANLVARVVYGPFSFTVGGQSIQLKVLTMDAAQQKANWCVSQNAWAQLTDKGTPGAPSDCP